DAIRTARADERVVARGAVDGAGCRRGRWRGCRRRSRRAEDVDIGCRDVRGALKGADELRSTGPIAVGVVEKLPGAGVVDDAVVRIMAAGRARRRVEARIAGGEAAIGAEGS